MNNELSSKLIDHTLLSNTATLEDIASLCSEAIDYDFYSVCVQPCYVRYAYHLLLNTNVKVCTVVGFPLGANTVAAKVFETKDAIANGAQEIDMVININQLKQNNFDYCVNEINAIKEACGELVLKVIVETSLLDEQQKTFAEVVLASNADFIKTSTGFSTEWRFIS